MRFRILAIVGLAAVALVGVAVGAVADQPAARPQVACNLPGQVVCQTDPECEGFGAVCDPVQQFCVCPSTDMGPRGDGFMVDTDGGSVDFATGGGGTTGGSTSGSAPREGGGTTGPARTGCSFVPGSAR